MRPRIRIQLRQNSRWLPSPTATSAPSRLPRSVAQIPCKRFRHALKPKGVLGIVDHRARPDADPTKSSKLGYLPEAWAIEKVEAAGFKLSAKSEINANPKDTKDYPDGVWTLPPTYRLGDKDHEKYAAIGESDRFTLRFVKSDSTAAKAPPVPGH